jgi:hypothetical protein
MPYTFQRRTIRHRLVLQTLLDAQRGEVEDGSDGGFELPTDTSLVEETIITEFHPNYTADGATKVKDLIVRTATSDNPGLTTAASGVTSYTKHPILSDDLRHDLEKFCEPYEGILEHMTAVLEKLKEP